MTLDTRIYVQGPVSHLAVFVKCNQLLGAHEGVKCDDRLDTIWDAGARKHLPGPPNGRRTMMNEAAQGWLTMHYRAEGALQKAGEHSRYCDGAEECEKPEGCVTPCWIEVSFDTAYSYRGPEGGCGDLHMRLVTQLGQWLDEQGIPWSWQNEFTGEIHERYEGLSDLSDSGKEASNWLMTVVAPAILAETGKKALPSVMQQLGNVN